MKREAGLGHVGSFPERPVPISRGRAVKIINDIG